MRWRGGRSAFWQALGVAAAWLYVVGLHAGNDGLWYQGDAPRHAANGLFWWDVLTGLPVNPMEFALGYYARYPVINPVSYPPGFYVLEGAAFALLGPSPFVAKGLVLTFALAASLYLTAWLRRFVSEEAGWGGGLLVLQPGLITWSHAIMLNVPSMTLGLAALYHTRRWLETPRSRHVYLAAFFSAAAILTYFHAAIIVPIILAWILSEGRWRLFLQRRTLALAALAALALAPVAWLVLTFGPLPLVSVTRGLDSRWAYYLRSLPTLFTALLLGLAGVGIVLGLWEPRWRREVRLTLIWGLVGYAGFSSVWWKEPRYIFPLAAAIVLLGVIGVVVAARWAAARLGRDPAPVAVAALVALLGLHLAPASVVRVPRVEGFLEVLAFLEGVAPNERVFYEGDHNGVFSFYLRARDPRFERGVEVGHKILYRARMRRTEDRVSSPGEVVEALRKQCGCRWLAIETQGSERIAALQHLRRAVTGPEFQLVRSFPIVGRQPARVDVYRFLTPGERHAEVEVRLPKLRGEAVFRRRPLER